MRHVTLRALTRDDFPQLRRWLETPHVARWWNHQTTSEALEADFGPTLAGDDPAVLRVALARGIGPFGFLQRYRLGDNPDYMKELSAIVETPPEAFSIDYFVGDPAMLQRGWGAAMIRAGLDELWREEPLAPAVIVPVNAANVASWRVLERAGFVRVGEGRLEPENPIDGWGHLIYGVGR